MEYLTPTNIAFAIMILSVLFNIMQYFRKPQEEGEKEIITLQILFQQHEKMQAETMGVIHNGLNTNGNAIKDVANALHELDKTVATLRATIEERIPQK
jgi:hypothetical protein